MTSPSEGPAAPDRPSRGSGPIVRVRRTADLPAAIETLGLVAGRPVIVLVGGAEGMDGSDLEAIRVLFDDGLAPLAEEAGAAVVDGGTDSGVMRLMGAARDGGRATFPLVGVAVEGTVAGAGPASSADAAPLEPHHTHFILVPGSKWGDEVPWLSAVAGTLAGPAPSVTVLVNGGQIALSDVVESVEHGRPVVVVSGTGRAADDLAAAARQEEGGSSAPDPHGGIDTRSANLARSGLLHVVDGPSDPSALAAAVRRLLRSGG